RGACTRRPSRGRASPRHGGHAAGPRRPRVRAGVDGPSGRGARTGCATRLGGADGLRLRRLLRLRRGDRRKARTPVCRRACLGARGVILHASGCLDALTAPEGAQRLHDSVPETATPRPREGNDPVRLAETDLGMLNSIGLANPGIDRFLGDTLPRLVDLGVSVWVSVGGFAAQEYDELCARLDAQPVAGLELNVSCPNVSSPEDEVEEIVAAARAATTKTLYAKLAPSVRDGGAAAAAAARAGADGLTLVNTIRGLALDERTLEPKLGPGVGGLSGPALRPIAL